MDARQRGKETSRPAESGQASSLNLLTAEFDALLERMQLPEVQAGTQAGFRASPEELGRAALDAARQDPKQ